MEGASKRFCAPIPYFLVNSRMLWGILFRRSLRFDREGRSEQIWRPLLRFFHSLRTLQRLAFASIILLASAQIAPLAQEPLSEEHITRIPLADVQDSPLLFTPFASVEDSDVILPVRISPRSLLKTLPVSPTRGMRLVETALPFVGTPYVFGGTSPVTGFDCSGFVQYVFGKWGVRLPRTAEQQFQAGEPVGFLELQPGDLIFRANTYKHGISHVGIYIGNGKWVHAASRKQGVIVSDVPLFNAGQEPGARRMNLANLPAVPDETPEYAAALLAKRAPVKPVPNRLALRQLPSLEIKRTSLASRGGMVHARLCGDSGKLAHGGCHSFKTVQVSVSRMRTLRKCSLHKIPAGEAR